MLDGPRHGVDGDRIADDERLVEHDGECAEQVAQDVLHRERDRDAADPESGNERRHVEAEPVERDQREHGPQHRARDETESRDRRAARQVRVRFALRIVAEPERDESVAPDRDLDDQRDRPEHLADIARTLGQVEEQHPGGNRRGDDEEVSSTPQQVDDGIIGRGRGALGHLCQAPRQQRAGEEQRRADHDERGSRCDPRFDRVMVEPPLQDVRCLHGLDLRAVLLSRSRDSGHSGERR